jgi:hypothetical protein
MQSVAVGALPIAVIGAGPVGLAGGRPSHRPEPARQDL